MVVIVCWICNQPFVHQGRGRRPDACPDCREQFTDKQYVKFRDFHRYNQEPIEDYYQDEDGVSDEGDYDLTQYEDSDEGKYIERKPKYVYTQRRNQHGDAKKSHWSRTFKDSQSRKKNGTPTPASHKITHEVFCKCNGLDPYLDYSEDSIYEIPRGYYPVGTVDPRRYDFTHDKHWNLGPWTYKIEVGSDRPLYWQAPDISLLACVAAYRHDREKVLQCKRRIKRMYKFHPERKIEDTKHWSSPMYTFLGRKISEIHEEVEEEKQLHIDQLEPREQYFSYYHHKIPGWVYSYQYDEDDKIIDYPSKIQNRIHNGRGGFWDPYFRVSNQAKKGSVKKLKIPRGYKLGKEILPGSETSQITRKAERYHKEDRVPPSPCPLCGHQGYEWIITKTGGVDKWGNPYRWKYTGRVLCCPVCGYVVEGVSSSLYY